MSAELFRYRGAARDGGTLEYIFESEEQDASQTATKERVAEIAADFYDHVLWRSGRRTGDPRIPPTADAVLARIIF